MCFYLKKYKNNRKSNLNLKKEKKHYIKKNQQLKYEKSNQK